MSGKGYPLRSRRVRSWKFLTMSAKIAEIPHNDGARLFRPLNPHHAMRTGDSWAGGLESNFRQLQQPVKDHLLNRLGRRNSALRGRRFRA